MLVVWSFTPKMFDFSPAKLLKFQIQLTSLSWPFAQPSVQITAKSRGHLKVSSRGFFECGTIPTFCRVVQLVRSKKKPLITLLYWFNTVIMEHLVDNVFYSHASIFQLTWQRFEGEFILCQEKKKWNCCARKQTRWEWRVKGSHCEKSTDAYWCLSKAGVAHVRVYRGDLSDTFWKNEQNQSIKYLLHAQLLS